MVAGASHRRYDRLRASVWAPQRQLPSRLSGDIGDACKQLRVLENGDRVRGDGPRIEF